VNIVVNTTHYYYGAIAAVKAAEDGGNGGGGERERERDGGIETDTEILIEVWETRAERERDGNTD